MRQFWKNISSNSEVLAKIKNKYNYHDQIAKLRGDLRTWPAFIFLGAVNKTVALFNDPDVLWKIISVYCQLTEFEDIKCYNVEKYNITLTHVL